MTEIEARGKIKYRIANEMRKYGENKEEYEDLEIAIQALKEIREYRELGTVEELQTLKEKEERFDRNIKMFNEIGLEIRNNAIDDFAEALLRCDVIDKSVIRRIAEQMKGEQL